MSPKMSLLEPDQRGRSRTVLFGVMAKGGIEMKRFSITPLGPGYLKKTGPLIDSVLTNNPGNRQGFLADARRHQGRALYTPRMLMDILFRALFERNLELYAEDGLVGGEKFITTEQTSGSLVHK